MTLPEHFKRRIEEKTRELIHKTNCERERARLVRNADNLIGKG
jgi:hypothetical protein